MSNFSNQLEETKALIRSESNSDKSFGYSTLLHLQEHSCNDQSSIGGLADGAHALISLIAVDIADDDEEIAAQALKCLGFMIYHPSIVASISDNSNHIQRRKKGRQEHLIEYQFNKISSTIIHEGTQWNFLNKTVSGHWTVTVVGLLLFVLCGVSYRGCSIVNEFIFFYRVAADDIMLVLQSLAKLITSTKMKTISNLGIWCISVQQINASFLSSHFHLFLRAVVHALDNPIGSLSTTFEAMQAVKKLASQVSENMRESSHLWAPPIYRRLLSADKRERDMSERCLLTIRFMIFPPPSFLSKALAEDMNGKLLAGMKELLDQGRKLQTMQAWGWFIRLLGQRALKNRHLINDMLKIPEQTFLDKNPQVQVASQVACEGLIDALIHPPDFTCVTNVATKNSAQEGKTSMENSSKVPASSMCSSIKLIMTPLIGIMSSKCDACVHSSSLSTWCYLLDKLGTWINHPSIVKLTLDPILQAVFCMGPNSKNLWSWNLCLDLLDDYILAKFQHVDSKSNSQESHNLSAGACMLRTSAKCSLKHYPVKWLPWDLSQFEFFLKMINIITSHISAGPASLDNVNSASVAALRILRSVLKGVQVELKSSSSTYNEIMMCLNTLLHFVKKTCEDVHSDGRGRNDLHLTALQFIEVVTEELEPSILGSTLYKVPLDPKHIENMQLAYNSRYAIPAGINSIAYMDMVSPAVYLVVLYMCKANESILNGHGREFILQRVHAFFKFILFLYDPLESLSAAVGLLYKYLGFGYLWIWIPIAEALKDCLDGVENVSLLKLQSDSPGYLTMCHLLLYPFVVGCCLKLRIIPVDISGLPIESHELSEKKLEFGCAVEVWKLVYVSCSSSNLESSIQCFPEELFSMLNECFEKNTSMLEFDTECDLSDKNLDLGFVHLFGSIVLCGLEQFSTSETSSEGNRSKHDGNNGILGGINCRLGFAARVVLHRFWRCNKAACLHLIAAVPDELVVEAMEFRISDEFLLFHSRNILHERIVDKGFLEFSWTKREKHKSPGHFEMSG
ncbi:uncharacterized protein LOC119997040 [Tripterygium wilfordii]|uniref:uncharacterized protein LOC119997040 n=1 Tax=Tripterygium wilfordii TaxID=458696 RepID=UPI0018F83D3A|nr:uncharacterized protein LOC119997040 [Tripterygium wilfordii]